ncbi:hypothetical protein AgCh_038940 [Apium graveolens]
MLKNIQTGMMIQVEQMGELFKIIMAAKWDNFVFYRGINLKVDSNSIHKAMRLGSNTLQKPCINNFEKFALDQKEFELYVGLFCDDDVPLGLRMHARAGFAQSRRSDTIEIWVFPEI